MLVKVVSTLASVDGILKCDLSSESYQAVPFSGAVYHVYRIKEIFKCFEGKDLTLETWLNYFLILELLCC